MVEIRTFVEVPFGRTGKETQSAIGEFSLIVFLNEPVLLMDDAIIGQYLDCLVPSQVHRLVFGRGDGEEFGQFHTESNRNVCILAHHTVLLYGEQWKLRLQGGYLAFIFSVKDLNSTSHFFAFFG